jgi:hypothetical protein
MNIFFSSIDDIAFQTNLSSCNRKPDISLPTTRSTTTPTLTTPAMIGKEFLAF